MGRRVVLATSPIVVIAIGYLTARVGGARIGVQVWIPLAVVFWTTVFLLTQMVPADVRRGWLDPSQGATGWRWLAMLTAATVLPLFLMQWRLVATPAYFLPWLIFGLVNPWFEERYWRGALLYATDSWPTFARLGYTAGVFALSHPLMFGVNSIGVRSVAVLVSTFVMGLIWAIVAIRSQSLRWCIAAHVLVDLFGLSVVVFENVWTPGPT